jgi:hypothetical protein
VDCQLCDEPLLPGETLAPFIMPSHRECGLRNVLGGIGHLMDHEYYCLELHDPDGGFTYRESARLVAFLVELKGGIHTLLGG